MYKRQFNPFLPYFEILPLFFNWWVVFMYLGFMGLVAVAFLAIFYVQDKKSGRPAVSYTHLVRI